MTPEEFQAAIKRDIAKLKADSQEAIKRTASRAVPVVKANTPKAFGPLQESIHADGMRTVANAPHAAAVEEGSRPHHVPLEELVKWVKLRGMQATIHGPHEGTSSFEHAARVGAQLASMETNGSLSIDAPTQIARAIQHAIEVNGTKPHWYVQKSLPDVMAVLDEELRKVWA